ncbi:MAG TPA: hypothetical protein VGI39_04885 [Polyangiaceae bacterium]|jgi:hypothetical protein
MTSTQVRQTPFADLPAALTEYLSRLTVDELLELLELADKRLAARAVRAPKAARTSDAAPDPSSAMPSALRAEAAAAE